MSSTGMSNEPSEMTKHVLSLTAETTSVDLSHFDLTTAALPSIVLAKFKELSLTTLSLPLSLQHIEKSSFDWWQQLTAVNIASLSSLTIIEEQAFASCKGLTGPLVLPDSVHTIGEKAFSGSGFTGKLSLPPSLLVVETFTFCILQRILELVDRSAFIFTA
jgi:hypothetical protein